MALSRMLTNDGRENLKNGLSKNCFHAKIIGISENDI